jgi:hypothetical protein
LTHSGYLFAGELYKNNMSSSPFWGTPIYFYLLFLAIKVPLLTLVAFLLGLFFAVKKPRHVGHACLLFMFLFWLVPYSLIGGKWLRYTLSVMPFVYMLAAVGVVGLIRCVAGGFKSSPRALFTTSAIALHKRARSRQGWLLLSTRRVLRRRLARGNQIRLRTCSSRRNNRSRNTRRYPLLSFRIWPH